MRMRPTILSVVILSAAVAAIIATALSQKQRMELMDAEERRQYLGSKLGGKLSDEQIDRIAEAVSTRLDAASSTSDPTSEDQPESDDQPEPDNQPDSESDEAETGAASD